jgi:hypothetical protein
MKSILESIDWTLLYQQKCTLFELLKSVRTAPDEKVHLEGVLSILDRLQDEAEIAGCLPHPKANLIPQPYPGGRWPSSGPKRS